ncbi:MAG: septum formation protein Maf [Elusimicrobia bacterium RIFCSPLOWO2_01_FULL_59_12]|nr:MAG: septum formation protein Maf [Elusimicrobia bacterium RIFCSPLOWO2_01_FULL_59_12]
MTNTAVRLILASKSPRRRVLLKALRFPFRVVPSGVSERSDEKRPHRLVQELARRKAEWVARGRKNSLVLGADTLVVLRGTILGQPKNPAHAYQMLYRLSGTTHQVFTGVALVDTVRGTSRAAYAVSSVRMKKLPIDLLLRLSRRHLDKAGSYAIQSKNDPIAKVVRGGYDNVVGLPVAVVRRLLAPYWRARVLPRRRIPS